MRPTRALIHAAQVMRTSRLRLSKVMNSQIGQVSTARTIHSRAGTPETDCRSRPAVPSRWRIASIRLNMTGFVIGKSMARSLAAAGWISVMAIMVTLPTTDPTHAATTSDRQRCGLAAAIGISRKSGRIGQNIASKNAQVASMASHRLPRVRRRISGRNGRQWRARRRRGAGASGGGWTIGSVMVFQRRVCMASSNRHQQDARHAGIFLNCDDERCKFWIRRVGVVSVSSLACQ